VPLLCDGPLCFPDFFDGRFYGHWATLPILCVALALALSVFTKPIG
jgi:hypothetical protein